jgi:hypothetical protein
LFGLDVFQIHLFWMSGVLIGGYILLNSKTLLLSRPLGYLFLFLILAVFSAARSPLVGDSAKRIFGLLIGLVFVLTILYLGTSERRLQQFSYALLAGGLGLVVISVWELTTGNHLPGPHYFGAETDMSVATAGFYNRNPLSLTLGVISPFAIYGALSKRSLLVRLLSAGIAVGIVAVVVDNHTRGAVLMTAASLLIVVTGMAARRGGLTLGGWPRIGLATYGGGAIAYLLIQQLIDFPLSKAEHGSIYTRWRLLEAAWDILLADPLPSGIGTFKYYVEQQGGFGGQFTGHNWAAELGVELSLVGLLLFVLMMGFIIDRLIKQYLLKDGHGWMLPVATSLLVFSVGSLSSSGVIYGKIRVFWIVVGLGIAYVTLDSDRWPLD